MAPTWKVALVDRGASHTLAQIHADTHAVDALVKNLVRESTDSKMVLK